MSAALSLARDVAGLLQAGQVVPYLGPGVLSLCSGGDVPATPEDLVARMTARATVPHKIRKKLTQAAQYIENFKHRKSVVAIMNEAFSVTPQPSALHRALAASGAALLVDAWYDDTLQDALRTGAGIRAWGQVQGQSQTEHFGSWTGAFDAAGNPLEAAAPAWQTLLYQPWGSRSPASNFLVSDTDFVEVLTEIDIQTPIPAEVQARRAGRSFLFLGCRFNDQLTRAFARQIMKRSSDRHWAVLPDPLTRMEERFLAEQQIVRIECPLAEFSAELVAALQPALAA